MDTGEVIHTQLICGQAFCLVDGWLWPLETVEIPGWLERFDELCEITWE